MDELKIDRRNEKVSKKSLKSRTGGKLILYFKRRHTRERKIRGKKRMEQTGRWYRLKTDRQNENVSEENH